MSLLTSRSLSDVKARPVVSREIFLNYISLIIGYFESSICPMNSLQFLSKYSIISWKMVCIPLGIAPFQTNDETFGKSKHSRFL